MAKNQQEKLAELEQKMAALKAKADAIKARQKAADRKLDTRRKIILGSMLIESASKDELAAKGLQSMIASLTRQADKKAFEGWTPPKPKPAAPQQKGLFKVAQLTAEEIQKRVASGEFQVVDPDAP